MTELFTVQELLEMKYFEIEEAQRREKRKRILRDWLVLLVFILLLFFTSYARGESCITKVFTITYYSNKEAGLGNYGTSGKYLQNGDVACGKQYKFGQKFIIGKTTYKCFDRGSAIKNNKLDIFVRDASVKKLKQLGKKKIKVGVCK